MHSSSFSFVGCTSESLSRWSGVGESHDYLQNSSTIINLSKSLWLELFEASLFNYRKYHAVITLRFQLLEVARDMISDLRIF